MSVMKLEIFQVCSILWHPHQKNMKAVLSKLTQYRYRNKEVYVMCSSALGRYVNVCVELAIPAVRSPISYGVLCCESDYSYIF